MRFVCLLMLIAAPLASAGDLLTPPKLEIINSGMEFLMDGQWNEAMTAFDKYNQVDTTDPGLYLFHAMTLLSAMTDRETNAYGGNFNKYLDSAEARCKSRLQECDRSDSAVVYLSRGHIRAYRSLYQARFGSSMAALDDGLKARGEYSRGLELDSSLYDLYLGLGSYHYWKSVKSGILKTVGIFSNEREEGIEEVHLAIDSSLFSKGPAKSALIWIYLNEKNYDSTVALATEMYDRYPHSNTFVWPIAQAYFESEQFVKAAMYYNKIFESLKEKPGNYFNLIESAWWLFNAYAKMNENGKAYRVRRYVDSVSSEFPDKTIRRQRKKLYDMKHHRW